MGKIHEERGRNFWMLLPLDSWAWFTILHFPIQIFMKQRKTQKSPRYHKLRILFNASNSLEGITPHYDVDGKIEKLWWLTHIYLRDIMSQPEKSKKVPFHHQHLSFPSHTEELYHQEKAWSRGSFTRPVNRMLEMMPKLSWFKKPHNRWWLKAHKTMEKHIWHNHIYISI